MHWARMMGAAFAAATLILSSGCQGSGSTNSTAATAVAARIPLTIKSAGGTHAFSVEVARTEAEQERGLMFRTNIPADGGMLFAPYPPGGGGPREASFWMKNTPSPLDIVFIRADGTIARIAENAIPYSTDPIESGEPVSAILELRGGRCAELGISEGDTVRWEAK